MLEKTKPVMTFSDILKVIPHRHPFIMVDRVDRIEEGAQFPSYVGRKIFCVKNVTITEYFFQGHFPHRPVMPGVLIIEAMAQAAALLGYRSSEARKDVAICSIKDAKFRVPVVPGDTLELVVECLKDRGTMKYFKGQAIVRGEVVAESEFLAMMFDMVQGGES